MSDLNSKEVTIIKESVRDNLMNGKMSDFILQPIIVLLDLYGI